MGDRQVIRQRMIYEALRVPKTVNELCAELGGKYHTIYSDIQKLKFAGAVAELPFPKNRQTLFQVTSNTENREYEIRFPWGKDAVITPGSIVEFLGRDNHRLNRVSKQMAGAMAHLILRLRYKSEGKSEIAPAPMQVKRDILDLREFVHGVLQLLEMMLLVGSLWEDDPAILNKIGEYGDEANLVDLAVAYEQYWRDKYGKA